jgi:isochorismate pyruvate lyase
LKAALRRVNACLDTKGQSMTRTPSQCANMAELREQIDLLDAELVALLARRAAFIDRAAELKLSLGQPARIKERIEQVIGNVRKRATAEGLDPELAEQVWRLVIEWSIRPEETVLGVSALPDDSAR